MLPQPGLPAPDADEKSSIAVLSPRLEIQEYGGLIPVHRDRPSFLKVAAGFELTKRFAAWDTIPEPNDGRLLARTDVKLSK
jgi:hypothetical protein